jgi:hypothetical protein
LFSTITAGDREQTEATDLPMSTVIGRGVATLTDAPLTDPELHAEMATMLAQMDTSIGQHARAEHLLASALASAERTNDPGLLAKVWLGQGELANARGAPADALALFEAAIAHTSSMPPDQRETVLTTSLAGWTYAMSNLGRGEEANSRLAATLANPQLIASPARRNELLLAQSTVTIDPKARLALLLNVEQAYALKQPVPADRLTLASMLGNS